MRVPILPTLAVAFALVAMSCRSAPPTIVLYCPATPATTLPVALPTYAPAPRCEIGHTDGCPALQTCCALGDDVATGRCMDITMCGRPSSVHGLTE
jgi:hypothetical protein